MKPDFEKLAAKFPPHELDWRIQQCGEKNGKIWALAIAYVDARALQDRLDQVCGPENWKDDYQIVDHGILCRLSIKVDGEWVTKTNGSPETDIEGFKGGISKAFVRACSNWQLGRYLYALDTTFAHVLDKREDGAKSAKTKEGKWFYWLPPTLPAWALPGVQPRKATPEESKIIKHATQTAQDLANNSTNLQQALIEDKKEQTVKFCSHCQSKMVISKNRKWIVCPNSKNGNPHDDAISI